MFLWMHIGRYTGWALIRPLTDKTCSSLGQMLNECSFRKSVGWSGSACRNGLCCLWWYSSAYCPALPLCIPVLRFLCRVLFGMETVVVQSRVHPSEATHCILNSVRLPTQLTVSYWSEKQHNIVENPKKFLYTHWDKFENHCRLWYYGEPVLETITEKTANGRVVSLSPESPCSPTNVTSGTKTIDNDIYFFTCLHPFNSTDEETIFSLFLQTVLMKNDQKCLMDP